MDFCIAGLIPDLQDVICSYAYKCTAKTLREDINTVVMIKSWNMPQSFFKARVRCEPSDFLCVYSRYVDNPVKHFIPSHLFGGWHEVFDWPNIYFLLLQFDFRLRIVRSFGIDRDLWYRKMTRDWRQLEMLSIFFKTCHRSNTKILKPTSGPLPVWYLLWKDPL